ncbi:MAG: hypothetical protein ABI607_13255 [Betaproteobacteria bacterium]
MMGIVRAFGRPKAAFEFALVASSVPNAVDAIVAARLRQHGDDDEIVQILGVIALRRG